MDIPERQVTAFIGPSGCGKSTLLRCLNRMNDLIDGVRVEGEIRLDGLDIYAPTTRRDRPAPARRHGVPEVATRSRSRSTRTSPTGCASPASTTSATLDETVERSLRGAALWDEVKDRLHESALGALGRPAAAAVHRARDRRRARGAADGRAVLGARPDRHAEDRGADPRAEGALHDRHRHPQHAAGGARLRLHRVLLPRAAGRVRRRRRRSSPRPRTSGPRTTSPAGSGEGERRKAWNVIISRHDDCRSCSNQLLEMGGLVEEQVARAMQALVDRDEELAAPDHRSATRRSTTCRSRSTTSACDCWRCTSRWRATCG